MADAMQRPRHATQQQRTTKNKTNGWTDTVIAPNRFFIIFCPAKLPRLLGAAAPGPSLPPAGAAAGAAGHEFASHVIGRSKW